MKSPYLPGGPGISEIPGLPRWPFSPSRHLNPGAPRRPGNPFGPKQKQQNTDTIKSNEDKIRWFLK